MGKGQLPGRLDLPQPVMATNWTPNLEGENWHYRPHHQSQQPSQQLLSRSIKESTKLKLQGKLAPAIPKAQSCVHSSRCSPASVIQAHPTLPIAQQQHTSSDVHRTQAKGSLSQAKPCTLFHTLSQKLFFFPLIVQRFRTVLSHIQETMQS